MTKAQMVRNKVRKTPEMVQLKMSRQRQKKERRLLRVKKAAVFLIVFSGTLGIFMVDSAYSDMCGTVPLLNPQITRVDEKTLNISAMGFQTSLDMHQVRKEWTEVQDIVVENLEDFSTFVRQRFDLDRFGQAPNPLQKEPSEIPVQIQML